MGVNPRITNDLTLDWPAASRSNSDSVTSIDKSRMDRRNWFCTPELFKQLAHTICQSADGHQGGY
jgi:hypothetical protein